MQQEPRFTCSIPDSGSLTHVDDYGIRYEVTWEKVGTRYDFVTTTKQPRLWEGTARLVSSNGRLLQEGIITTTRKVIEPTSDGYVIVASGSEQHIGFYELDGPCTPRRQNRFCYDFNNAVSDEPLCLVTDGVAWTDPDNPTTNDSTWDDLVFIDVWS